MDVSKLLHGMDPMALENGWIQVQPYPLISLLFQNYEHNTAPSGPVCALGSCERTLSIKDLYEDFNFKNGFNYKRI